MTDEIKLPGSEKPPTPPKGRGPTAPKEQTGPELSKGPLKKMDVPGEGDVPDPDGDPQARDPKYAEPPGTHHGDQYRTRFPDEPRQDR